MADMSNPDGVLELAGVWHEASGGFHGASSLAGSCQMSPELFGSAYSGQMANVRSGIEKIQATLTGWGERSSWYKGNLHNAVDTYQGTDEGNASGIGSVI
jgi:hypothetical protein